jgi:ParB family transcriptional regulator, chromosome partitioning protein
MKKSGENKNKKALGRGIGSLLGSSENARGSSLSSIKSASFLQGEGVKKTQHQASTEEQSGERVVTKMEISSENRLWHIAVEKLKPSPFQPRQVFKKEELEELAQSIKQKGILQPIIARKVGDAFEIIAGERRWRAGQIAGLHEVPVILKNFDDLETLEMAIIENIQRADLSPIEEAEAYQKLATQFQLNQSQIAEKVGKERATIANALRLLQLPNEIRDMIQDHLISQGHAKVLLGLSNEKQQLYFAKKIINESLSVRKLEALLRSVDKKQELLPSVNQESTEARAIQNLQEKVSKKLNTKVEIRYEEGQGHIKILFYQKDQFNDIVDKLTT